MSSQNYTESELKERLSTQKEEVLAVLGELKKNTLMNYDGEIHIKSYNEGIADSQSKIQEL